MKAIEKDALPNDVPRRTGYISSKETWDFGVQSNLVTALIQLG